MVEPAASHPARGALAVIGVFALGVVFGLALSFVIVHHVIRPAFPGTRHGGAVSIDRVTRKLDLDAAQQDKVRAILERGHAKMGEVLDETRREIRAELRPEQQQKFDSLHPLAGQGEGKVSN